MSLRHLKEMQSASEGQFMLPNREVLALPDNLLMMNTSRYDPFAFGTPGGAPALLGPEYPVIVDGPYTFVFASTKTGITPRMCAYFKMENPKK